jgi:hypothetical protein
VIEAYIAKLALRFGDTKPNQAFIGRYCHGFSPGAAQKSNREHPCSEPMHPFPPHFRACKNLELSNQMSNLDIAFLSPTSFKSRHSVLNTERDARFV